MNLSEVNIPFAIEMYRLAVNNVKTKQYMADTIIEIIKRIEAAANDGQLSVEVDIPTYNEKEIKACFQDMGYFVISNFAESKWCIDWSMSM